MAFNLTHSDGTPAVSVLPLTVDSTSTSLTFVGRGVPNFGEIHQTNFLRILENFASANPPANPSAGQMWYKSSDKLIYVYDGAQWRYVAADAVNTGTNAPNDADVGDLWYDTATGVLYVYNNGDWVLSAACACQVGPNPPTFIIMGQLWFNTGTNTLMTWTGTVWQPAISEALQYLALLM